MSATAVNPTAVSKWNLDAVHSVVEFKVKHMMISNVKGHFTGLTGSLTHTEGATASSSVQVSIDAATISTGDAQRDGHLKSADFFDVEKFPTLEFKSTQISDSANGELKVAGDLTIHGVTKKVTLEMEGPSPVAKDPWGNSRIGLSGKTKINRKDFGLTWNTALETGGILVGEEVQINLDVQFVKS